MFKNHIKSLIGAGAAVAMMLGTVAADAKPKQITIFTSLAGSSWYGIGAGMAEIFGSEGVNSSPELGAAFSNIANVAAGKGEMGLTMLPAISVAANGTAPFKSPITNVKVVAALSESYMHIAVNADKGINSVADLKGKPFVTQPPGAITALLFEEVLAANGLSTDALQLSRGSLDVQLGEMKDRRADGMVSVATFPAAFIAELSSAMPVKLLPVDDAAFEAINAKLPAVGRSTIPANTYEGQAEPVETISAKMVAVVPADMSDEDAYWIAKTLVENLEKMRTLHGSYRTLNAEAMATVPDTMLHAGAEKFYRESGALK
ncbi:TAXI family TRAP transporter solute-binding subunit [Nitratireductor sp.]|uniref:TAXI family TRAP transporter solute-binding subunit n=1 Tax=Nitratireductor sp. TaxID=1872084 RepID=UPI00261E8D82|nr:TAXI family TRAP transporter solute-binding subunit [Nitratireductor sp.]MCV0378348.1 TAXI family TRAP transporter solute-binding subunit [Nitratireductor sp.]